jgi:hypothetical protein
MTTRRKFLQGGAAASVLAAAPAIVRGQNLNSKLQLASIGSDGKGLSDIKAMSTHDKQQYVAYCDIDLNRTLSVKQLSPETPVYQDFREMFAELGDKIDAVTVSTPEGGRLVKAVTLARKSSAEVASKSLPLRSYRRCILASTVSRRLAVRTVLSPERWAVATSSDDAPVAAVSLASVTSAALSRVSTADAPFPHAARPSKARLAMATPAAVLLILSLIQPSIKKPAGRS